MKHTDLTDRRKFLNQQYDLSKEERNSKEIDNFDFILELLFFPVMLPIKAMSTLIFISQNKPNDTVFLKIICSLVSIAIIAILSWHIEGPIDYLVIFIIISYANFFILYLYGKTKEIEKLDYVYCFLRAGIVDSLGDTIKIIEANENYIIFTCSGISLKMLTDKQKSLETSLNLRIRRILPYDDHKTFKMEISKEMIPEKIDFDFSIINLARNTEDHWLIGYNDEVIYLPLENLRNILLNGACGSGKSVALRCGQTFLLISSSKNIEMFSFDFKGGLEQEPFSPWLSAPVVTDADMAVHVIDFLYFTLEYRMQLFRKAGVNKIEAYREIKPLPRIILLVDEYADLKLDLEFRDKLTKTKEGKESLSKIQSLARRGRACGLHLIICTQYSEASILDSQIKNNMISRQVMKMYSQASSRNILESDAGFQLPDIKGRHIFNAGGENLEVQGYWLSEGRSIELLDSYAKRKLVHPDFIKYLRAKKEDKLVAEMQKENCKRLKIINKTK